MEYKQFVVRAFERRPGMWRAGVRRADGEPVKVIGRRKLYEFVTTFDAKTAVAAMLMAVATIDAGYFSRDKDVYSEKFWRRKGSKDFAFSDRSSRDRRARARRTQNPEKEPRS